MHYRDNTDLEIDAIVEARYGRWAAFEVNEARRRRVEGAAANLLTFVKRIDTAESGVPVRLGVIVATGCG